MVHRLVFNILKISYFPLAIFILLLSLFFRLNNISQPLLDAHYFRQTQTATYARNFYYGGIDLLHPKLDIAGLGKESILILEFPFFEAIVAFLSRSFHYSDSIGRGVSIFFGLFGGVILFMLSQLLYHNRRISLYAMIFFLFAPINIFFQQAFMIESTVVALHIYSLYLWYKYVTKRRLFFLFMASFATLLAFLQKSVYAPFLLFPILITVYGYMDRKKFSWSWIVALSLVLVIFTWWIKYVDYANILAGHSYFTLSNKDQQTWNFGEIRERFSFDIWKMRVSSILSFLTKFFLGAFALGVYFLIKKKIRENLFLCGWLFSLFLYYLIFFRIQSHDYYFMIITPPLALVAAIGLASIQEKLERFHNNIIFKQGVGILVFLFLSLFIFKGWKNSLPYFSIDGKMVETLEVINKTTIDGGNTVFIFPEYDWNSVWTYYTGLKGYATDLKGFDCRSFAELRRKGYKYLIFTDSTATKNSSCDPKDKDLQKIIDNKNILIYELV